MCASRSPPPSRPWTITPRTSPYGPRTCQATGHTSQRDTSCGGSVAADDHSGADGLVGAFVDQDEAAGRAVAAVLVDEQRLRRTQFHAADLVERQLVARLARQRVHVEAVEQLRDLAAHVARRVLDRVLIPGLQRAVGAEPADLR